MVYNHKEMDNIINNMHMVKCLLQYNKKQLDNKVINKCKNQLLHVFENLYFNKT